MWNISIEKGTAVEPYSPTKFDPRGTHRSDQFEIPSVRLKKTANRLVFGKEIVQLRRAMVDQTRGQSLLSKREPFL